MSFAGDLFITDNIITAAALSCCGINCKLNITKDAESGFEKETYQLTTIKPMFGTPLHPPFNAQISEILKLVLWNENISSNEATPLHKHDPNHHLLFAIEAAKNFVKILQIKNKGGSFFVKKRTGSIRGQVLGGIPKAGAKMSLELPDLDTACYAATLGYPTSMNADGKFICKNLNEGIKLDFRIGRMLDKNYISDADFVTLGAIENLKRILVLLKNKKRVYYFKKDNSFVPENQLK